MSKATRLLSGGFFGALLLSLGLAVSPVRADVTWKLSCDGNTCCAVSSSGQIGDCFEKSVSAVSAAQVASPED